MSLRLRVASIAACVSICAATEARAQATGCEAVLNRSNVASCVVAASYALRSQAQSIASATGQIIAARPVLPSNPQLELSAAHRAATLNNDRAVDWSVTLRQEIEVAGQRGERGASAEATLASERSHLELTSRDVAADGWRRYFETLAATAEIAVTEELVQSATFVEKATRAGAERGLLSPLDADVARAARTRIERLRFSARRNAFAAHAGLAGLLRADPTALRVEGSLDPLQAAVSLAAVSTDTSQFPEVRRLQFEQRALAARASLYRRLRVPNPTVSVFAENDGFNERVFGAGLSFPIPLPQPLGRTNAGEIAQALALAEKAEIDAAQAKTAADTRLRVALDDYRSRVDELALFDKETVAHAHRQLHTISEEIAAGRLSFRDASIAQQALVELLLSQLDAQLQLSLASVQLARAANLPLERGIQ